MSKANYAKRNVPAGILMLIYGIFLTIFLLLSRSTNGGALFALNVMLGPAMIIWAVTLLLGKRNALPAIAALILAIVAMLPQIILLTDSYNVSALSGVMALFWILTFLFLPFVMFGGVLPQLERTQKMAKTLWFLPALFMAVNTGIDLVYSLITIIRYSEYMDNARAVGVLIGATIRAVIWVLSLLFACQWAIASDEKQKNAFTHPESTQQLQYQPYQQPQYQGYQQPQYQGYQQPKYQNYQQPQYQNYQQTQYQNYQQPQQQGPQPNPGQPQDPTEVLRRFKGLLDDGIITQEEFDAKKKQLLG